MKASPARMNGRLEGRIVTVRGVKTMLDSDLAELYGVSTSALNQAVKRNVVRFPSDFMFKLSPSEFASLRSHSVISKNGRDRASGRGRHRKYLPYAFTEQGVAMLSSVLRSERAVQVNIQIMRVFVRMRSLAATHADLKQRLDALERKYDRRFKVVFDAIRALMQPPARPRLRQIGFRPPPGSSEGSSR